MDKRCSPNLDPSPPEAREKGLDGQGAAHPTEILLARKRGRRVSMDKALLTQPDPSPWKRGKRVSMDKALLTQPRSFSPPQRGEGAEGG